MPTCLLCPSLAFPNFDGEGVSELQERILELLEEAQIPTEINDKIMDLISEAESRKAN